ncbi:lipase [Paraburkholderia bryophila]|uniref:alpha/beta fold hydrolase n=1 Tax=Paraburkholderia bryophila TaxID=420952 RepID=UPI00234A621E|nr:alpha/beta fold hydrolase [Paraburkholderia bryophila]WCM21339.1 lipase [Paraburkholderia bryophila]
MNARDYALLAQEAYSAKPDIGIADSASRAIVRQTADGLCIAFRGSDDLDSWLHNLDSVPVSVTGMGAVHRGFHCAWSDMSAGIIGAIGDKPVTLIGHSLGGAICLLAAAALTLAGKPPVAVWAFEPPRVSFDMTLRVLLSHVPLHLWRNGSDPVPDLPLGGVHPGLLTHIGKSATLIPSISDHLLQNLIPNLPAA